MDFVPTSNRDNPASVNMGNFHNDDQDEISGNEHEGKAIHPILVKSPIRPKLDALGYAQN
ncbi:hypothetical protein [Brucella thiophenivorans]|uniref:Uncharacterized protein n=1 Tax=Brucella thiophenivorans TaxID=571255 RepID=A0A256FE04_9HYPH|nr:hypothetical protein [Brucella thiophenivorans]OYR13064.1 hypothetical protein CEV31_3515 [Brucella thiophenivorans]